MERVGRRAAAKMAGAAKMAEEMMEAEKVVEKMAEEMTEVAKMVEEMMEEMMEAGMMEAKMAEEMMAEEEMMVEMTVVASVGAIDRIRRCWTG